MKDKKTEREALTEELLKCLGQLTATEIGLLLRIALNMIA